MVCTVHTTEASNLSKNGIFPLTNGICVENKQKIEHLIGHLESKAHQAATEAAWLWEQTF
jgi:hypothetical protein